ncbi:MAG: saccharopine dehydrogenase C-terminal domain-containing protein [Thermoanaerobaculia bacterium]
MILGAGRIGATVAWDLAKRKEVVAVGLADASETALTAASSWISNDKVAVHLIDIKHQDATVALMRKYDVGVVTLPLRGASYKAIEAAILAGLSVVDVLEEYHRRPDEYEFEDLEVPNGMSPHEYGEMLHGKAVAAGVTILDGMGFAPGLSNVTVGEGLRTLDVAHSAVARVGGIPSKDTAQTYPLRYVITWSFDHVLREYMVRVPILRDGQIVEVEAASDYDSFRFNECGKDEQLESAITPGMPSFIHTRPQLRDFSERTIRWPGHWSGVRTLKECGLLALQPIPFRGTHIAPRDFVATVLRQSLHARSHGERDACVMWNTVIGSLDSLPTRIDYYMWDDADTIHNISSMARVTAFTAAAGAIFVGERRLKSGIIPPEDAIFGDLYSELLQILRSRGITISQRISAA